MGYLGSDSAKNLKLFIIVVDNIIDIKAFLA